MTLKIAIKDITKWQKFVHEGKTYQCSEPYSVLVGLSTTEGKYFVAEHELVELVNDINSVFAYLTEIFMPEVKPNQSTDNQNQNGKIN